jgi:hypothetical protein
LERLYVPPILPIRRAIWLLTPFLVKLFFSGLCGNGRMLFWFSFVGGLSVGELLDCSQTWWLGHWASQYREGRDVSEVSVP